MVAESDSGVQWFEERTGADAVLMQYLWGLHVDEITHCVEFEMGMPMTYYMMCSDLLYRSTALLDNTATIEEVYDTDAYGNTLMFDAAGSGSNWWADDAATTNDPLSQFIFTGRRLDPELSNADSQVYYYRMRYYAPALGRFISKDPIAYRGGMGLYEYVGGMPTIFMDPMGLLELPDWAKGAVSAVARVSGFGVVGAVAEAVSPGIAGEAAGVATEVASNVITPVVTSVAGSVASLALGKEARAAFAQILGAVDEDLITCACLSAGIVDIALGDPATELIDCACNIMTAADLFAEGRSAAGWAYLTLTVADCLSTQIGAALGAAVLSLVGASGGTAAAPGPGTAAGGAAGAAAGSKVGAVVGGVIIDVLAMGAQNLITQDTVLPKEQYEACCRVGKKLRGENKTKCTNHG